MSKERGRYLLASPTDLPVPWDLNETWLDRLDIPPAQQRQYRALKKIELIKLESDRRLALYYAKRGILQLGKTPEMLVKRTLGDIDTNWLLPRKRRAVDFKGALSVLNEYAMYCDWAKKFRANHFSILYLVMPYQSKEVEPLSWSKDTGFVRIQFVVSGPRLGKRGEVSWASGGLYITEHAAKPWCNHDQDGHGAPIWDNLDPELADYKFPFGVVRSPSPHGFVDHLHATFRQVCGWSSCLNPWLGDGNLSMSFNFPQPDQVQRVLNYLAKLSFACRFPRGDWQLQFDVSQQLDWVTVASVLHRQSPFGGICGTYYRERNAPLNP